MKNNKYPNITNTRDKSPYYNRNKVVKCNRRKRIIKCYDQNNENKIGKNKTNENQTHENKNFILIIYIKHMKI